jgi:hypothetical protein
MKTISLLASVALVCSFSVAGQAQVMSKADKANPSTQGYGTSGAALKDQRTNKKTADRSRAAANQQPPGNSPAETAGAATPNDSSRPGKSNAPTR